MLYQFYSVDSAFAAAPEIVSDSAFPVCAMASEAIEAAPALMELESIIILANRCDFTRLFLRCCINLFGRLCSGGCTGSSFRFSISGF